MNFSIAHFSSETYEGFTSYTLVLENPINKIVIDGSSVGLIVGFEDSMGLNYQWYQETKQWMRAEEVCDQPTEWVESFWNKVTNAQVLVEQLQDKVL